MKSSRLIFLLRTVFATYLLGLAWSASVVAGELQIGVFNVDASPPAGSPLAYDRNIETESPLSCRGIVLVGAGEPIVLCSIDWIGVANDGFRVFREEIAQAVGTSPERVAVHAIHQHDAPGCDFSLEPVFAQFNLQPASYDAPFARRVMAQVAQGARAAKQSLRTVTHVGIGKGRVDQVASNRRILDADGKVKFVRFTATKDPAIQAYPAGIVDPILRAVSFYEQDEPIVVLTYFATHPQSYYRTAKANPDFPGMARNAREAETGVPHIHFNGAGGNIGAGKWNDGAPANRPVLAERMQQGMRRAWESTEKYAVGAEDLAWRTVPVALPPGPHLVEQELIAQIQNRELPTIKRETAACDLVWLRRCQQGDTIDVSCLALGPVSILHLPGELFVEYQLAAQRLRPDRFVALAAYGEYGPGYIGTEVSYSQGGYETTPPASRVAPSVEGKLMDAVTKLLQNEERQTAGR